MYAVIVSGGKQYRVTEGQYIDVEKIEMEPGATFEFENVLLVGAGEDVKIGAPYLQGCKVKASIEEHGRGEKINILNFKRRKHHMKRKGHRQWFTRVRITQIAAA